MAAPLNQQKNIEEVKGLIQQILEIDYDHYATAEQGSKADSAVQPGEAISVLSETTDAKIFTASERNKLENIAEGATANDTNANLRNRATHTGTQSADTLTDGSTNRLYSTVEKNKLADLPDNETLQSYIDNKIPLSLMGEVNGVATLDEDGKIPAIQLPSYVDDVLEFADLASFPPTGESNKIYIAIDTNMTYRWSGSAYVEIASSPGSTDNVPEGPTNKYFTSARVRDVVLLGISFVTNAAITASDTVLSALGKLQAQITALSGTVALKLDAAAYTAADVLAKIKTVDGSGSGLDAELLNGQAHTYYLDAANLTGILHNDRLSGNYSFTGLNLSGGKLNVTGFSSTSGSTVNVFSATPDDYGTGKSLFGIYKVASDPRYYQISIWDGSSTTGIIEISAGTFMHNGNNVLTTSSSISAANLTGTIASDRISGSYTGIVGTGALNAGSITSGFGNINIGTATFTGNGSGLTSLNASNLSSGTIPNARMAGGYNFTSLGLSSSLTAPVVRSSSTANASDWDPGFNLNSAGYIFAYRVNGNAAYFGRSNAGIIVSFFYDTAYKGNISVTSTQVTFNQTSDARLKEDCLAIDTSIIDLINPYNFRWIATKERDHGFIAQEINGIIPNIAMHDTEDGRDVWTVNYIKIIPLLTANVKELRTKTHNLAYKLDSILQSQLISYDNSLHEDKQQIDISAVDNIDCYNFLISDTDKRSYGIDGLELQNVIPEAVKQDGTIVYDMLIPLCIETIKDLRKRVSDLEEMLLN